jgi:antitoxin component YwqK of YwqJK toxin-antitoxin module
MEGNWRFGKVEGPWTYWYENGTRESAGRFRAGKREGSWAYWDTTGKLRFEGNWTDGALDLEGGQAAAGEH